MKINILGLGESIKTYSPDNNTTIGVNDVFKFFPVDHLVVIDPMKRFTMDRLHTIINSKPKQFYSNYPQWKECVNNFNQLNLSCGYDFSQLDNPDVCLHSNNSVFVACVLAYKLKANDIVIYGADFNTHPNFHPQTIKTALLHFETLRKELKKRNVNLFVSSRISKLSTVLPVY